LLTTQPKQPNIFYRVIIAALLIAGVISACEPVEGGPSDPVTARPASVTPRPATAVPATSRPATTIANAPGVSVLPVTQGFGASKGFWQVYFTAPTGSRDASTYVGGIDEVLGQAISSAQRTIDFAAFEFNSPALTRAIVAAAQRGVTIRMVTDDEHGLEDSDSTINQLTAVGVQVVDDSRSALMHDKFMIIDGTVVWTGSWNYTINDTYRNNNNAISLRTQRAVQAYQAEFDEMFTRHEFGGRSTPNDPPITFTQDGTPIQIYFAAEEAVVPALIDTIRGANRSIRFMAFSFTLDDVAEAIEQEAASGVQIQGIFETTGSNTEFSELRPLFCAGLQVRRDGNPFVLHHKVFIIDDERVVFGSFNFSSSARDSNDENMLIIRDPDLAAQFIAEFNRRWAEARTPTDIICS
jgi:phosphatidylserine/phosphatidylglycerophosphate/cardiolipin synthase-like enzyme